MNVLNKYDKNRAAIARFCLFVVIRFYVSIAEF
ncbi:hypothetical protein SAMN05421736_11416 [Evansella caseinilytica]|uniref:Uncharacterized protein n=1 Tax=Evansella caseinilytica TaxID=1503961 RepID=A0A1H3TCH1_9BACI|nr:hypothetical protein SAMN05421736_11416 [Evansella caseinilytica]